VAEPRVTLVMSNGLSRRVGVNGLLIGRHRDCDIVISSPTVSRRHALVRVTRDGAELLPLGRVPIEVNGKAADRARELAHGDTIALPGLTLMVEIAAPRSEVTTFRLEHRRGARLAISHSPFAIGGGEMNDLIIKRWPERALRFHVAGRELYVEVLIGKATVNGIEIAAESVEPLAIGDTLVYRKETFVVARPDGGDDTTVGEAFELPSRISIHTLPRGGRVEFVMPDVSRSVILAERRLDLVIALLRPPPGYKPGDFIPDEIVCPIVWPREPVISRQEINMLISRCRRDLVQAGLAGTRLLERAPGGGGTRLALAPGAEVVFVE
jgi:pSer/pThr/pTyr-binding forkhead associated (FHA) protein